MMRIVLKVVMKVMIKVGYWERMNLCCLRGLGSEQTDKQTLVTIELLSGQKMYNSLFIVLFSENIVY